MNSIKKIFHSKNDENTQKFYNIYSYSDFIGIIIFYWFIKILGGVCIGLSALVFGWILNRAIEVLELSKTISLNEIQITLIFLGAAVIKKYGITSGLWYVISIALTTTILQYVGKEFDTAMIIALFFYTTIVMKSIFEPKIIK